MSVTIDQSWQDDRIAEFDDAGAAPCALGHLLGRSHCADALALDEDCGMLEVAPRTHIEHARRTHQARRRSRAPVLWRLRPRSQAERCLQSQGSGGETGVHATFSMFES